ncbi:MULTISPECIES: hypothetical protein [unclassified Nocardia]|uniref:hypothetical protein n=1 Tax=unclassified Nocardia TaxID=2637762 RepID=UPI0036C6FDE7
MAYQLNCPCGTMIVAADDDLVPAVQEHLRLMHPGRSYSTGEIMMLAMPVPDGVLGPDA